MKPFSCKINEESEMPPLDVVKVELKEEDESGGGDPGRNEVDSDVKLLESGGSSLSDGLRLSRGSEKGERLGGRLPDLGEKLKLEGWERKGRLMEEKDRDLKQRIMMTKRSKPELPMTYELEVDHGIKAEREVAELRKKFAEKSVAPVRKEAAVGTLAKSKLRTVKEELQQDASATKPVAGSSAGMEVTLDESRSKEGDARPQNVEVEVDGSSSCEEVDDDDDDIAAQGKAEEKLVPETSGDESDVEEATSKNTDPPQQKKTQQDLNLIPMKSSFSCHICNKQFSWKFHLQRHLETHNPDKIYKCEECEKRFKTAVSLKLHLKSHDPDRTRDFVCPTCSRAFYTSKELEVHLPRHTGERPYPCSLCSRAFEKPGHLQRHVKAHLKEDRKFYHCPFCDKKFNRNRACREHQQSCHKSELAASLLQP